MPGFMIFGNSQPGFKDFHMLSADYETASRAGEDRLKSRKPSLSLRIDRDNKRSPQRGLGIQQCKCHLDAV